MFLQLSIRKNNGTEILARRHRRLVIMVSKAQKLLDQEIRNLSSSKPVVLRVKRLTKVTAPAPDQGVTLDFTAKWVEIPSYKVLR